MIAVYVIGPFRAPTQWEILQNVQRAEQAALELATAGFVPVCPHSMFRNFHGILSDQFWLDATMELLHRSDLALRLDGWRKSNGSCLELVAAAELGIWIGATIGGIMERAESLEKEREKGTERRRREYR